MKPGVTRAALWCSLALNVFLAVLTGDLWLERRAERMGLDTRTEAFKSVFGASMLSRASLSMRVGEESPGPGLTPVQVPPRGEQFYVRSGDVIANGDIGSAKVVETPYGSYDVEVSFTPAGAARVERLTEQNLRKRLVISVDGRPLLAPVIYEAISEGRTRISGSFTKDEAKRIVLALSRR